MGNELHPGFKIEHWYQLLIALGAAGVIAALTVEVKGISNVHALFIFAGVMFVGIGEWVNHPLDTKLMRPTIYAPNGGVASGHPRKPTNLGNLFNVLGFVLIVVSLFKITIAA